VVDVDGRSVLPVVGVVDVVLVLVERARALAGATEVEVEVEVAVAVVALPQPGTATARPATTSIWATRTDQRFATDGALSRGAAAGDAFLALRPQWPY